MVALGDFSQRTISSCSTLNGFLLRPDIVMLEVEEQNIAPFSVPQEALSFEPLGEAIISHFRNGDWERKIHCNIELLPEELEGLRLLQEETQTQGIRLLPSLCVAATRYLSHARGDYRKALKLMEATQEWRLSFFSQPLTDTMLAEDLKHGIMYYSGRDKALRPLLTFRASRIPAAWHRERSYGRVIRLCCFCIEYFLRYMVVPGRIESFCVMIDLKDVSLTQIPVGVLREVHRSMGAHYVGRVSRFYICNMPWLLSSLLPIAKKVLTDRQRQKLVFVNRIQEIEEDISLRQIEEDLGGMRPMLQDFFPFAMLPGPFSDGNETDTSKEPVPRVHEVLTAAGSRGRLWNLRAKSEDNRRLEFSARAADIFRRCNLPVPLNALEAAKANQEPATSSSANPIAAGSPKRLESDSDVKLKPSDQNFDETDSADDTTQDELNSTRSCNGSRAGIKEVEVIPRGYGCCWSSKWKQPARGMHHRQQPSKIPPRLDKDVSTGSTWSSEANT